MESLKQIQSKSGMNQPNNSEMNYDLKRLAVIEISAATAKAKINFGVSRQEISNETETSLANDIAKELWSIHRNAKIEDVVDAIRLFSLGEIRFENQMNVVSVMNVMRAYTNYRFEYKPKNAAFKPVFIPPSNQLPDATALRNKLARREMFEKYIDNPKEMDWIYEKFYQWLLDIGTIQPTAQQKIDAYRTMATNVMEAVDNYALNENRKNLGLQYVADFPGELYFDGLKRKEIWAFKNLVDTGIWPEPSTVANNSFHKYLVKRCKMDLINTALQLGKEKLMADFNFWFEQ